MKKLCSLFITIALVYPNISYAINPEDCEKDGEIVFTRECINEMLNQKKAEPQQNVPPKIEEKTVSNNQANKPDIGKTEPVEIEKPVPLGDKEKESITVIPVATAPQKEKTELTAPTTQKLVNNTTIEIEQATNTTPNQCNTRSLFRALETKNHAYITKCGLTPELINAKDTRAERKGRSPLHWAVITENHHFLRQLLTKGANTDTRSQADLGASPLHIAVQQADIRSIKQLLQSMKSPDTRNLLKETPLHLAVKTQNEESIRLLLKAGANIEARDRTGKTPLLTASLFANPSTIELLLENKAKIDVQTKQGNTPLHYSVLISPKTTEKLLHAGARLDSKNAAAQTPLEKLRDNFLPQHRTTIELIENHVKKDNGLVPNNPLLVSLESNDLATFKKLLERGISPSKLTVGNLHNKPKFTAALRQAGWIE